jgi:hypothetical protein
MSDIHVKIVPLTDAFQLLMLLIGTLMYFERKLYNYSSLDGFMGFHIDLIRSKLELPGLYGITLQGWSPMNLNIEKRNLQFYVTAVIIFRLLSQLRRNLEYL